MLLTIDIGNSNIVAAIFNQNKLLRQWRLATDLSKIADEYAVDILDFIKAEKIKPAEIKSVIIASVVPNIGKLIEEFCLKSLDIKPILIGNNLDNLGIEIKIDDKYEVGEDRLVNAVAAFKLYKKSVIIIDFGTATTFDIIDEKGNYLGGVIAPGVNLSINALSSATAKLPKIAAKKPSKVIGTNTISAMQSGIFHGYVGLINGVVANIKAEYKKDIITVATGGLSAMFRGDSDQIDYHEPDLTIIGLQTIYNHVKK